MHKRDVKRHAGLTGLSQSLMWFCRDPEEALTGVLHCQISRPFLILSQSFVASIAWNQWTFKSAGHQVSNNEQITYDVITKEELVGDLALVCSHPVQPKATTTKLLKEQPVLPTVSVTNISNCFQHQRFQTAQPKRPCHLLDMLVTTDCINVPPMHEGI